MTGSNTAGVTFGQPGSHGFGALPVIWGWATWKDRWGQFDGDLETYQNISDQERADLWPSKPQLLAFERHLDSILHFDDPDTWDYQWAWTVMSSGGRWVVPNAHLFRNVGFRDDSTTRHRAVFQDDRSNLLERLLTLQRLVVAK